MSPSSDFLYRCRYRLGGTVVLIGIGLSSPVTASAMPSGTTAAVVAIHTSTVNFAGGTAELDGSTTLENTGTGTKSRIDCTVLFAKDSDHLQPGAKQKLRRLARQLRRQGPGKVRITGYTDDLGSAAHGLDLSRRRARRVATELAHTLPAKNFPMTVHGRGEANPAVPNNNETNRRKNRRVNVTLTRAPEVSSTTTTHQPAATPTPKPTPTTIPSAAASPTIEAPSAPPSPTEQPTFTERSTPAVLSPPQPQHRPWPLAVFLSMALVAAGALIDVLRRRRASPATRAKPPHPDQPGQTAEKVAAAEPVDRGNQTHTGTAAAPPRAHPDLNHPTGVAVTIDTSGPAHSGTPNQSRSSAAPSTMAATTPADRQLDADLTAWFSADTHRPRLTLLGPVHARTRGQALARRKPYYTELLAYLTLKPHGATADQIADTFTLTTARVRTDMKILRDWLGNDPTTGTPYLPDARTSPAALQSGVSTYQVRDVLCDWLLLTGLQRRISRTTNEERRDGLDTALRLVSGRPFSHTRTNGWGWIFEGDRLDLYAAESVSSVARAAAHYHQEVDDQDVTRQAPAVATSTTGE